MFPNLTSYKNITCGIYEYTKYNKQLFKFNFGHSKKSVDSLEWRLIYYFDRGPSKNYLRHARFELINVQMIW